MKSPNRYVKSSVANVANGAYIFRSISIYNVEDMPQVSTMDPNVVSGDVVRERMCWHLKDGTTVPGYEAGTEAGTQPTLSRFCKHCRLVPTTAEHRNDDAESRKRLAGMDVTKAQSEGGRRTLAESACNIEDIDAFKRYAEQMAKVAIKTTALSRLYLLFQMIRKPDT